MFEVRDLAVYYGEFRAVREVNLDIRQHEITAFIGPSGCGKSTVLRCFDRMNDLIESARVEGTILYHGVDLYARNVDPVEVRRRVGMVFQKPNPFPKSIYDNLVFGPRLNGIKGKSELDHIVEHSLRRAALWDEVKDRLKSSALGLSGGQQQRLCIARCIAVEPDVILMDEPCSALDPIATARIEELMKEIVSEFTIVIVTHNMQQAARVSDRTAFFTTEVNPESDRRTGVLVEFNPTSKVFSNPGRRAHRDVRDREVRMMTDLRPEFHNEVEELRNEVARLGAYVVELIPRVTDILLQQDLEGAEYVLRNDAEIDARATAVEEKAITLLALQAPVARDLRQIASVLKLAPEIERSADLCCNICKAARRIYGHDLDPKLRGLIQKMSDQAHKEYKEAVEAYLAIDGVRSAALPDMDGLLDDIHRQFIAQILESHAGGTIDLQVAVQLAVVARFYERLGDHAVNIANRIRFIATGVLPEHEAAPGSRDLSAIAKGSRAVGAE